MAGRGSSAGLLAYGDANQIVMVCWGNSSGSKGNPCFMQWLMVQIRLRICIIS